MEKYRLQLLLQNILRTKGESTFEHVKGSEWRGAGAQQMSTETTDEVRAATKNFWFSVFLIGVLCELLG